MNKGFYKLVGTDRKYNEVTIMTLSHNFDIKYMYDTLENLWDYEYEDWRELRLLSVSEDGFTYTSEVRKHYWSFEEREKLGID